MKPTVVGLISDTHGILRPEALRALEGSDVVIHAGDVGKPEVLEQLRQIAPTFAVRGNIDSAPWTTSLPVTEVVEVGEVLFYVLHDLSQLELDPSAAGFAAVVFGHSHKPGVEFRNGVWYVNPGSAGPRRFTLPVSVARVVVEGRDLKPEIVELKV